MVKVTSKNESDFGCKNSSIEEQEYFSQFNGRKYCRWMEKLPKRFHKIPLPQLTVPGTHNSAAHQVSYDSYPSPEFSLFRFIFHLANQFNSIKNFVNDWTITQDVSIYEQLKMGVRDLDLRLTFDPVQKKFLFTHKYTNIDAITALNDIKKFLNNHKGEVVILHFWPDWEHARSMTNDRAEEFLRMYKGIFGELLHPEKESFDQTMTLEGMVKRNQRIITFFNCFINANNQHTKKESAFNFLWNPELFQWLFHLTANPEEKMKKTEEMLQTLDETASKYIGFSYGLTFRPPQFISLIFNRMFSLDDTNFSLKSSTQAFHKQFSLFVDRNKERINRISTIETDFPDPEFVKKVIEINFIQKGGSLIPRD